MLYLNIHGFELRLKINQFREDLPDEAEYDNWCSMDFSVMRNGVNIYHNYKNLSWLTCDEVKKIRDTIAGVRDGSITKDTRLSFIEPDIEFEFVFYDGKFSYVDMILGYWETEGRGCFTGNRLVLCLSLYDIERMLGYLQLETHANYEKDLIEKYCREGAINVAPDKISFKIIDGEIAVGEIPKYAGVVGIFINDRELLDIVAELEDKNLKGGAMDYIHQTAKELYYNLVPDNGLTAWQNKNGAEILSCTCGIIKDGSPTVFIEKDEQYVYWKAFGHNQINYRIPFNYVFDKKQYEQALEELKKFAKDKNIY